MDISIKRIVAFAIDIVIVSLVLVILTSVFSIDPYYDKYQSTYDEYSKLVKKESDVSKDELINLNYDLYKYRTVNNGLSIVILVLYFGVLQMLMKGQTLGKKMMNIKVVSNKDKNLHFGNYLVRCVILNNIIFLLSTIILVYVTSGKPFYYAVYIISLMESLLYMTNIFFIVFRSDNRGIHDMIAGTKVTMASANSLN